MRVVVLTVDQRGSRTGPDLVPDAIAAFADGCRLLPFERTAGDEMQASRRPGGARRHRRAPAARRTPGTSASASARSRPRSPTTPAPAAARRTSAPARRSPGPSPARGTSPWSATTGDRAATLETVLWLWAAVLARRTAKGWEVADLVATGLSYDEAGRRLGISQSAVSQRAQAAGLVEGRRRPRAGHRAAADLLEED